MQNGTLFPSGCTEQDHKALREKYVAATEQLQAVTKEAASIKATAEASQESARKALQVIGMQGFIVVTVVSYRDGQ